MRGTFFGIEIGRTGITLGQLGLDVTGHNIANVDTRGYTRQRIIQTANDPFSSIGRILPVAQAKVGGGTRVQVLDQIRSAYLDRRFRTENTASSYWETRTRELSYLESFFDNVNEKTSINYNLNKLFSAMKVMAEDPVEGSPRKDLQTAGLDLVQQLNSIFEGLIALQDTQNKAVEVTVTDINRIAEQLVELNKAIYGFELTGHIANDLRDKRNVLLDDLSGIIDIQYEEYTDRWGGSAMRVWFPGSVYMKVDIDGEFELDDDDNPIPTTDRLYLVDHDVRNVLDVRAAPNPIPDEEPVWMPYWVANVDKDGVMHRWEPPGLSPVSPAEFALNIDSIRFGELKALIDMRDNAGVELPGIPNYIEQLNNLARALVAMINDVHRQGWTDPPLGGSQTGINFFYEDNAWISWQMIDDTDPDNPIVTETLVWDPDFEDSAGNIVGAWVSTSNPANSFTDPSDAAAAGYARNLDASQITIKNIRLSDEVMESEYNIAASTVQIRRGEEPEDQQRGNNENMNALFALFGSNTIAIQVGDRNIGIGSFDSFATSIRVDVGRKLRTAMDMADTSRTLTLAAELQRTSVSGVSLDEEMTNLIKYNHAYNGASRVITAMDDVLDRLINGTGRVGL